MNFLRKEVMALVTFCAIKDPDNLSIGLFVIAGVVNKPLQYKGSRAPSLPEDMGFLFIK